MKYQTQDDLKADLAKAVVHVEQTEKVDQQDWSTIHQARCLVEHDTDAGVVTERETQRYYVLPNGEARLAKLIPAVRDYHLLKTELADPSYDGLSVDDAIAALESKEAQGGRQVTFRDLAESLGLDRMLAIESQLEADAVGTEIISLIRGEGVTAGSDEYNRQVDYVASVTDLTNGEADAAKSLAKRPWLESKKITLRRYMVESLIGA